MATSYKLQVASSTSRDLDDLFERPCSDSSSQLSNDYSLESSGTKHTGNINGSNTNKYFKVDNSGLQHPDGYFWFETKPRAGNSLTIDANALNPFYPLNTLYATGVPPENWDVNRVDFSNFFKNPNNLTGGHGSWVLRGRMPRGLYNIVDTTAGPYANVSALYFRRTTSGIQTSLMSSFSSLNESYKTQTFTAKPGAQWVICQLVGGGGGGGSGNNTRAGGGGGGGATNLCILFLPINQIFAVRIGNAGFGSTYIEEQRNGNETILSLGTSHIFDTSTDPEKDIKRFVARGGSYGRDASGSNNGDGGNGGYCSGSINAYSLWSYGVGGGKGGNGSNKGDGGGSSSFETSNFPWATLWGNTIWGSTANGSATTGNDGMNGGGGGGSTGGNPQNATTWKKNSDDMIINAWGVGGNGGNEGGGQGTHNNGSSGSDGFFKMWY